MYWLVDFFHFIFGLIPSGLLFVKPKSLLPYKSWVHGLLLVYIITPLHWYYFNDTCIITHISKTGGNYSDTKSMSPFSEKWYRWLYEPLLKISGRNWNEENLSLMVHNHACTNIFFMWVTVYRLLIN
jgi:hypothetical protein